MTRFKTCYAIKDGQLILEDEELDLSLKTPFTLPSLPEDFATSQAVTIKRDLLGNIERAFLEKGTRKHGECRFFYPSGTLKARCYYAEGKLHGPSTFYGEEGQVVSESWFYLGQQEGKVTQYYANGALYCHLSYRAGQRTGKQEYFYEDGTCRTIMHYKDGVLDGELLLFWPLGTPKRKSHFAQGKRVGADTIWNEDGLVLEESQ